MVGHSAALPSHLIPGAQRMSAETGISADCHPGESFLRASSSTSAGPAIRFGVSVAVRSGFHNTGR